MNDNILRELYAVISDRKENPEEGSYTCYLFSQGIDKILKKVGADEIIYADGETADKLAIRHNGNNIFDYISLTDGYAIFEVPIMKGWENKSIGELDVRKKYRINIIAIKRGKELDPAPMPDFIFHEGDHIFVMGKSRDVFKMSAKT